jgi:hypothetical protein
MRGALLGQAASPVSYLEQTGRRGVGMDNDTLATLTVTIPFPSHIPRARGVHAVGRFGTLLKTRCSETDKELVQQAADLCGVSYGEFIRWVCVHAAKRITDNERDHRPTPQQQSG